MSRLCPATDIVVLATFSSAAYRTAPSFWGHSGGILETNSLIMVHSSVERLIKWSKRVETGVFPILLCPAWQSELILRRCGHYCRCPRQRGRPSVKLVGMK